MSYRLGVDVGGTFTDLLLIDETTSKTFRVKTPSTPSDQSEGVLSGIAKICQSAGITPDKLTSLMHGTTVATNAILEGKGARVGLIVTDGYRQVLHIGRSFVPGGLAGWIIWQKPETLATLENTMEVKERIGAKGDVVRKLDEASVRRALKALAGKGVEAITVSLINAFANDAHEKRIREIAEKELPKIPISLSCEILPEMRRVRARADDGRELLCSPDGRKVSGKSRRGVPQARRECAAPRSALGWWPDGIRKCQARAGEPADERTGGRRERRDLGRQTGRLREPPHLRYGRHVDRRRARREWRGAAAARDGGQATSRCVPPRSTCVRFVQAAVHREGADWRSSSRSPCAAHRRQGRSCGWTIFSPWW